MSKAAMQDADEAIGNGTQGLVVRLTAAAVIVVEAPDTGRGPERGVCPAEAHVRQVPLRATRASTVRRVPEARVIGAVPAYALRALAWH
jgi:hypothetical protein